MTRPGCLDDLDGRFGLGEGQMFLFLNLPETLCRLHLTCKALRVPCDVGNENGSVDGNSRSKTMPLGKMPCK